MTEKQGGSDVRANTTTATPLNGGGPGAEYEITGHKWFCSAPMCDAFLVLAQTEAGISCFLMPRWTPDGERNRFHLQRLKDKLGNRSNASSEVEFRGAWARLVGEEGARRADDHRDGQPHPARLRDRQRRRRCAPGVVQAIHHAAHRSAFGKPPGRPAADAERARRPLRRVGGGDDLGDAPGPRLRRGRPPATSRPRASSASPTRCSSTGSASARPCHAVECLECLGRQRLRRGVGDAAPLPRGPLASIWEGSGNVQCLDVLRAMVKSPASVEAFFAEVGEGAGAEPRLDAYVAALRDELPGDIETIEARARRVVERMALALQGSLLVRYGDPAVADAFCASRLAGDWGQAFGTLPAGTDFGRIIERHHAGLLRPNPPRRAARGRPARS